MALAKALHVEQGETRSSGAIAPQVRYIEMFGGVGGFRLGLESVDNDIEQHYSKWNSQFKNVGYYEWDKYAVATYNANFGGGEVPTDVTKVEADDFPDHDILTGGFPCQAFSIAGRRRGFEDARGTLFFEIARVAQAKRPSLLLLENVRGLLSHDKGNTFGTILETLDEIGYDVQWEVLNSKNFGVPQNRERIFIIGHLRGRPRPQIFPLGSDAGQVQGLHGGEEGEGEVTPCLTSRTVLGNSNPNGVKRSKGCVVAEHRSGEFREYEGECYTLQANSNGGGIHAPNVVVHCTQKRGADRPSLRHNKNAGGSGHLARQDGLTYCLDTGNNMAIEYCPKQIGKVGKGGQGNRIYDANGIAITQTAQGAGIGSNTELYWVDTRLRKLTPRECARLQGFPDWFEFPVSDTQAYKQMGNAVTVNVVREIGKELLAYFNHAWRQ